MAETEVKPYTSVFTEIKEVFDEWVPCEVDDHEQSSWHGGALSGGEWYVIKECPGCGETATLLVCNEYADLVRKCLSDNLLVGCTVCGCTAPMDQFFKLPISRKPLG